MSRCICIKELSSCDDVCFKLGVIHNYEFHSDPMSTGNRQFIYTVGETFFTNRNTDNFYDYFMDLEKFRQQQIDSII